MENKTDFESFGGIIEGTSAHLARTLMIPELTSLFQFTPSNASIEEYSKAIIEDNCLQKTTVQTRKISFDKLKLLYSLDSNYKLFAMLRALYEKAPDEIALLAFVCAYCRDYLLRVGDEYLQSVPVNTSLSGSFFVPVMAEKFLGRFTDATLISMSQNLLASFFKTGHVSGTKMKKVRSQAKPGSASVTYAAAVAYAMGMRGMYLCDNEYVRALDCSKEAALSLLSDADAKGLISLRLLGEVMDVQFIFAEGIIS